MLYVYTIQQRQAPPGSYISFFTAGTQCQAQISRHAREGSLLQRYGMVLEELRIEVLRNNPVLQGTTVLPTEPEDAIASSSNLGVANATTAVANAQPDLCVPPHPGVDQRLIPGAQFQAVNEAVVGLSPNMSSVPLAGWRQFDSLLTGGFGGLDNLLSNPQEGWAWV